MNDNSNRFVARVCLCLGLAACSSSPAGSSDPEGMDAGMADSSVVGPDVGPDAARMADGAVIVAAPSLLGSGLGLGYYHVCLLDPMQNLICSGSGSRATPPAGLRGVQIAASHVDNCVITVPGSPQRVVCFGNSNYPIPRGLDPIQLASGDSHHCSIERDRTVRCWGAAVDMSTPPAGLKAKAIAASGAFTCAVRFEDDEVVCWGVRPALPPPGLKAVQVAVAQNASVFRAEVGLSTTVRHACAVKADGAVVCWGDDTSTTVRETVIPAGLVAKEVAVGSHHSCALRLDGTVICWGSYPRNIPMPAGLKGRTIRAGHGTTCVLRETDDTVACFGSDVYGMASGVNGKPIYVPR